MATLTFFKFLRVIQVDSPVEGTTVTCQELINAIRDYEDELSFLDYGHIANAFGKQSLGGGSQVGITLELINNWRIQFQSPGASPTITVYVAGGNLVATNDYNNNPIKASDYVTVIIAQSSSPTIITPPEDLNMLYLIESMRGSHKSLGSIFYWNPTSGSDANDGSTPSEAVATFAQAQTLATAGAGDVIFALSTATGGITTVTEKLTISKAGLKVRGAGYQFQLAPSSAGAPTVNVTADSVEFSGFYVTTAGTGSDNGITVTGDSALIKDCWVKSARGNGIDVSSTARTQIDTCAVEDSLGTGIKIGASTTISKVRQCILSGNGADGVDLSGSSVSDNIFENNLIFNNTGYGIEVGTGVLRTGVRLHHTFSGNTLGATQDTGTGTFIETQAGGASASEIADAVWDEVISGHVTAGTTGKTLKDAKTKATLASLK